MMNLVKTVGEFDMPNGTNNLFWLVGPHFFTQDQKLWPLNIKFQQIDIKKELEIRNVTTSYVTTHLEPKKIEKIVENAS